VKTSAFADDVVVGLSCPQDRTLLLEAIGLHESACNAKLNIAKSESLPLSAASVISIPPIGQLLPRDQVFTHLGIPFHPQCWPLPPGWFHSLLEKLQATVASWQKRKISLGGKVLVLNSRLLSKLWYLAYFVSFPSSFYKRLQKLVSAFLWDERRAQVSLSHFLTAPENGGLGLRDVQQQVLAIKGWWLQRMASTPQPPWLLLAQYNFRTRYAPLGWSTNLLITPTRHDKIRHKGLWADIYAAWRALDGSFPEDIDPLTIGEDPPLNITQLAGVPTRIFTIKSGSIYLQSQQYPLLQHGKWINEDPACILDWPSVWKYLPVIRRTLPPTHAILWWRFLHHNIMTANRLHHMDNTISPACRHCQAPLETPGHLLFFCPCSQDFWTFIFSLLRILACCPALPAPSLQSILYPFPLVSPQFIPVITLIQGFAMWTIMRHHWASVFDNAPFTTPLLRASFCASFSFYLRSLFVIAQKKQRVAAFRSLWCHSPLITLSASSSLEFSF